MTILTMVEQYVKEGLLSENYKEYFLQFYFGYKVAIEKNGQSFSSYEPLFLFFLERLKDHLLSPHIFKPYHKKMRTPFDHYQFGLDFFRPLIDFSKSSISGLAEIEEINNKIKRGENVIFLSNHQIEADPQALCLLLEKQYPKLAKTLIFVAGERVVLDPLAVPFSLGLNLLCIYSKRYIDHPPEQKLSKQIHNKRTMEKMSQLLSEGGHAIWVAPSGGRDRPNPVDGTLPVTPFDFQSIEMFYLMAQKASHPTSFYPMALSTYNLLPPPKNVEKKLGEARVVGLSPVHLWIGPQISMEEFPGHLEKDKKKRRELRAHFIWSQVKNAYEQISR